MFLLLIFFMVSSTFRQYDGIDVNLPQAANSDTQDSKAPEIRVTATGAFLLEGEPVSAEELREGLLSMLEADEETVFLLRADADAMFERVVRAIDVAKEVGGDRLIIPTIPLQDETGL